MFGVLFLIVIGTSIWVAYDSQANKVSISKKPYSINNGALAWFLSCILIWIITFPYYLSRRSQVLQERESGKDKEAKIGGSNREDLIKCPYCAEFIKKEAKICRFCQSTLVSPRKSPQPQKRQKETESKVWVIEEPDNTNP